MKLLVLFSILTLVTAAAKFEFLEEWNLWKAEHGKSYSEEREELERHTVWLSNRAYIEHHNANADIFGFTLRMNQFGDMTDTEFQQLYLTYKGSNGNYTNAKLYQPSSLTAPDSIDWRTKGAVSSVKSQGQCGASYAFSAMAALEGSWALAKGSMTVLSEQNIIDCSVPFGNYGCMGGNMHNAFAYVIANEGVDKQSFYSYRAKQSSCIYDKSYRGASMSGSVLISSGSEGDLMNAVAFVGPVTVAIDGSSKAFIYYYSGVYDSSRCSSYELTHAMVVTGYGNYNGKDYWLVKNSWGTNWGMSGYILMVRGNYNQCGIATDASYPTL